MVPHESDPTWEDREGAMRAQAERWDQDAEPIVADLARAGFPVSSPWDLVPRREPYPEALPVLLAHLKRGGYEDRNMEGMARAMAVPDSSYAWEQLRELYVRATGRDEAEGLAVALAASATSADFDSLIQLVGNESNRFREHLLRAIKRVGGERGFAYLEGLADDPFLGEEARVLTRSKTRRKSS